MENTKKVTALKGAEETLEARAEELRNLQIQKAALSAQIVKAEEALVPLLGKLPSEGTRHFDIGGFDVVVTTRLTRRLDQRKAAIVDLPEEIVQRVLPATHKLVVRELKWLHDNNNAAYRKVRRTFKTVAGKPGIKFKALK